MTYGNSNGIRSYGDGNNWVSFHDNYSPDGNLNVEAAVVDNDNNWTTVGNTYFLRANTYDANRANLTIYNQDAVNTVTADVSSIYSNGDTINARNVQDYFVDIQTLTVAGGNITVNMQAANRTVATPVQWTAPASTFPTFGCFVLEKVS